MAQRYGGRHSPQGNRPDGTPPAPIPAAGKPPGSWRTTVLFLTAFAFLFPAFGDAPSAMLLGLVAGGLLVLSAWLSREGLRARAAWEARKVARRPAIPRLLLGAAATGAALFTGGVIAHGLSIYPAFYALLGAALHLGAFGLDPMADKGMEGVDPFQTDRVARAVEEAEKRLAEMKSAILRAGDRGLEARVDRFAAQARALFRRVESDPRDLTAARKYLSVYLAGARDATAKFADLWAQSRDAKARADWEALLTDLETTFADRSQALLENGRTDLDIEIGVLRDRLKFETR
ncbi:5-bromo-4-chloroindolyl phosphate hydrolysis family protein [Rhodobacter sp. Har01]|uniref:5-bromo-4-chloroindolyl phosphate hydrolysis family protein n=1 Tax=Rhodobacter sp. Har01 TaxID=2883999 RepID=UPI001D072DC6|nr:5-bromo-4-chloroindolyl phosphate hydrolysis family protein [Rhodobacter sp. Har01]MCB6178171.1 5-bromo-4-chloroindolyl phosphate hydrolysis family protein [Rhodobacter sp. Har01]